MASVEKLEKLFDKLYSDTFSIMKDTVSDMRKHIWNGQQIHQDSDIETELAKKTEQKIANLKNDLSNELLKITGGANKTGDKVNNLEASLSKLLNKAVLETKNIESVAKEETLREYLFRSFKQIRRNKKRIIADYIVDKALEDGVNPNDLLEELNKMKEEGYIDFEGNRISNGTVEIILVKEFK